MSKNYTYYGVYRWVGGDPDVIGVIRRPIEDAAVASADEIFSESVPKWRQTTLLWEQEQHECKIDWIGADEALSLVEYFRREAAAQR